MALSIPKRHRPTLARLLVSPPGELERLATALGEIEAPTLSVDDLAKTIAAKTSLKEEAIDEVLAMLISLHNIPRSTSVTRNQLLVDLLEAIESDEEFVASPDQIEAFKPFITQVMGSETLGTIAKSFLLLSGYEKLFCKAKIYTDLRPVFPDEIEEDGDGLPAVVATHMLRLSYHPPDFSTEDFYVALGSDHLQELADVIERARKKETRLRKLADKAGVAFLAMEDQC